MPAGPQKEPGGPGPGRSPAGGREQKRPGRRAGSGAPGERGCISAPGSLFKITAVGVATPPSGLRLPRGPPAAAAVPDPPWAGPEARALVSLSCRRRKERQSQDGEPPEARSAAGSAGSRRLRRSRVPVAASGSPHPPPSSWAGDSPLSWSQGQGSRSSLLLGCGRGQPPPPSELLLASPPP